MHVINHLKVIRRLLNLTMNVYFYYVRYSGYSDAFRAMKTALRKDTFYMSLLGLPEEIYIVCVN